MAGDTVYLLPLALRIDYLTIFFAARNVFIYFSGVI